MYNDLESNFVLSLKAVLYTKSEILKFDILWLKNDKSLPINITLDINWFRLRALKNVPSFVKYLEFYQYVQI